mmetsp:Transcript_55581/g.97389  ORF Transcript_55581/g.97389 Transcript_55581/m.97389 type:complete len:201 (+) Transcript_55581:1565-2167(+)
MEPPRAPPMSPMRTLGTHTPPADASGDQITMLRSIEVEKSRYSASSEPFADTVGIQVTEVTQSSCPTKSDSSSTAYWTPSTTNFNRASDSSSSSSISTITSPSTASLSTSNSALMLSVTASFVLVFVTGCALICHTRTFESWEPEATNILLLSMLKADKQVTHSSWPETTPTLLNREDTDNAESIVPANNAVSLALAAYR